MAAAVLAVAASSSSLVSYRPLKDLLPHALATILLQAKMAWFTPASLCYTHYILNLPNVTLERCNVLNPATLLPTKDGGEPRDCLAVKAEAVLPRSDWCRVPLLNPECILYVDGSESS